MAVDVKTQTSVLRRNIGYYLQYLELETATIASAKTLGVSGRTARQENQKKQKVKNKL
jgi:hypothetical protein